MAPLAKAFRDIGWEVSGSDKEKIYPPISTYLEENKISYFKGFNKKNVPDDTDLVVVGRYALMFGEGEEEYRQAQDLKLNIKSYPEVLQEYLIKNNSVVVAGTYGKTTISALISWILINAGYDPSYMIGGVPLNMDDGVKITDSSWSVIEGDEVPSLHEDDPPKFLFYNPKYLILTATKYDHPEIFKSEQDYLDAFSKLVSLIPKDGILVYSSENVDKSVVENCRGKKISYGSKDIRPWKTSLLGKFNLENITAVYILCSELGIEEKVILDSISSFKGVKTRLEFLGEIAGRFLYWDFSQHPSKIKGALSALVENYPKNKIWCIFDPSMTGLKYKESLEWYHGAFDKADMVMVGKVGYLRDLKGEERVSGGDIAKKVSETQKNVIYEPVDEKLIEHLLKETQKGDVIVFMSSGGLRFTNLIEEVKNKLGGINDQKT